MRVGGGPGQHYNSAIQRFKGYRAGGNGPLMLVLSDHGVPELHGPLSANQLCLCTPCEFWDLNMGVFRWANGLKAGLGLARPLRHPPSNVRPANELRLGR